jgi:hypothetical protein
MPDSTTTEDKNGNLSTFDPPKHHDRSFFHAYCSMPHNVTFANQEPGEQVVLLLRAHFITNVSWITIEVLLSFVPLLLFLIVHFSGISLAVIPQRFMLIFLIFYYLIIFGYGLLNFITWFYNVGIITRKRVIDIDFTDIMSRNVAESRISDVVDAEFNQGGILHSFLDFGDVFVQTEGLKPNFDFNDVPHPSSVVDLVLDLKEAATHE